MAWDFFIIGADAAGLSAAVAVFTGMTIGDMGWFDSASAPPYAPVWNALISAALKGLS
jgi:hypothetical protein